jgi:hypothetical protein
MQVKTRFHSLLEQEVNVEIEQIKEDMANGIVDNNQYWRSVGLIEGLRGALRLCEDLERDLE